MPNLRYFYQVLNGATYKVFGYPHWGTNKWRHKYDSYNLNHGIKFSDGKLAGYLKISIIFSLTERLRSFLQNRRFLREFHYGLGILKTISLKLIRSDTFYDIHIIYMHLIQRIIMQFKIIQFYTTLSYSKGCSYFLSCKGSNRQKKWMRLSCHVQM